jgi:methylated-DNA-[protein]-cysteine S-methyltransferase
MYTVIDSPVGPITLVGTETGLSGLYLTDEHFPAGEVAGAERDDDAFADVVAELEAYFAGTLTEFTVPLAPRGTPFQQQVWAALREVPYGETTSYGELAQRLGRPTAARAVGHANGHNPISIIVPCHRVIGAAGALTGYAWGLPRKRFLLDLERARRERGALTLL